MIHAAIVGMSHESLKHVLEKNPIMHWKGEKIHKSLCQRVPCVPQSSVPGDRDHSLFHNSGNVDAWLAAIYGEWSLENGVCGKNIPWLQVMRHCHATILTMENQIILIRERYGTVVLIHWRENWGENFSVKLVEWESKRRGLEWDRGNGGSYGGGGGVQREEHQ